MQITQDSWDGKSSLFLVVQTWIVFYKEHQFNYGL